MKVLITGHRGFIGSNIGRAFDSEGIEWIGYDLQDGQDIRDTYKLDCVFESFLPDVVIHMEARAGSRKSPKI